MATLAQIRAAIKATLQGVAGVGQVHEYERYATREKEMRELFLDAGSGRLLGWVFYRERTSEQELDIGEVRRLHTWRLYGFMGLDDASQTGLLFDDLVELVAGAFRADPTLGGLVLATKDLNQSRGAMGLQVERIEPVMFGGVLCHRATLSLLTETTEDI
jgi:hypothetical protein